MVHYLPANAIPGNHSIPTLKSLIFLYPLPLENLWEMETTYEMQTSVSTPALDPRYL